jgi:hypothetical protein
MECINPMRFFFINTYDRHAKQTEQKPTIIPRASSPPPLLRHQVYFIPITGVHLRLGEQVSRTVIFSDPAPEEGE